MEQLPNGLAFGGHLEARFFGLWLHDDLETGRSCAPCSTYQDMHAVLASSGDFSVDAVELWAVDEDVAVDDEPQGTALDGVMGEQHAETRSFLEMAGKTQHAATLAPEPMVPISSRSKRWWGLTLENLMSTLKNVSKIQNELSHQLGHLLTYMREIHTYIAIIPTATRRHPSYTVSDG